MTIKPLILGLGLVLGLTGCHQQTRSDFSPPGNPPPPPPQEASECSAEDASFAMGESATERLAQRAMMASGADTVRIIEPDMSYTMEFEAGRLNLETDDNDIVRDVRCG